MTAAVLEFAAVSKAYGGLRPLRIAELCVAAEDRVALLGFDQPSAETFVNLATGATLPDAGEIRLFGRATRSIDNPDEWLTTVDRFGIVSERAVLLDALTVIQNQAMPVTLTGRWVAAWETWATKVLLEARKTEEPWSSPGLFHFSDHAIKASVSQ